MATKEVCILGNLLDNETQIAYLNGQRCELPADQANRLIAGGYAVSLEEEELKSQSVEELKGTADQLGVDVEGSKSSKAELTEKIKNP